MRFERETAEIFVPDGLDADAALARTTHLAIAAHQDDVEIMAFDGIGRCFGRKDLWFCAVVVTDGGGSPRDGLYGDFTDEEMRAVRRTEQKKAAVVGEYGALVLLDHPSATVKDATSQAIVADLVRVLQAVRPPVVYTHNLADKHDTHVAVALRAIEAARRLPAGERPRRLYGCEVWRDLDWLLDEDKVAFDLSAHENLQAALLGVFDSQISGGKRYDLATLGRRRANATYYASHDVDTATSMGFAMDLTPLIQEPGLDAGAYVQDRIARLGRDVAGRLQRLQRESGQLWRLPVEFDGVIRWWISQKRQGPDPVGNSSGPYLHAWNPPAGSCRPGCSACPAILAQNGQNDELAGQGSQGSASEIRCTKGGRQPS